MTNAATATTRRRRFWSRDDMEICAVAVLLGVKPDSGMVNDFNDLERDGRFDDCAVIGDFQDEWLAFQLDKIRRARRKPQQD